MFAQPGADGRQIAARAGTGKVDAVAAHGRHKHGVVGAAQRIGGEVAKRLTENGIDPQEVKIIAELTTKRYEFPIAVGLLALDHSWYNGREDYELELEVSDETQGKIDFSQLLEMLKIPYQKAENKILRAMNR